MSNIESDIPRISAPALRALNNNGIFTLHELSKRTKNEIAKFHGMGPKALLVLEDAMSKSGRKFKS